MSFDYEQQIIKQRVACAAQFYYFKLGMGDYYKKIIDYGKSISKFSKSIVPNNRLDKIDFCSMLEKSIFFCKFIFQIRIFIFK